MNLLLFFLLLVGGFVCFCFLSFIQWLDTQRAFLRRSLCSSALENSFMLFCLFILFSFFSFLSGAPVTQLLGLLNQLSNFLGFLSYCPVIHHFTLHFGFPNHVLHFSTQFFISALQFLFFQCCCCSLPNILFKTVTLFLLDGCIPSLLSLRTVMTFFMFLLPPQFVFLSSFFKTSLLGYNSSVIKFPHVKGLIH